MEIRSHDHDHDEGPELQDTDDYWVQRPHSQLKREKRNAFLIGVCTSFGLILFFGLFGFIYYLK